MRYHRAVAGGLFDAHSLLSQAHEVISTTSRIATGYPIRHHDIGASS